MKRFKINRAGEIKVGKRCTPVMGGIDMAPSNKYCRGFVLLIILVFFFVTASLSSAETKVFVEEYTYQASEADSKLSSRAIAFE